MQNRPVFKVPVLLPYLLAIQVPILDFLANNIYNANLLNLDNPRVVAVKHKRLSLCCGMMVGLWSLLGEESRDRSHLQMSECPFTFDQVFEAGHLYSS